MAPGSSILVGERLKGQGRYRGLWEHSEGALTLAPENTSEETAVGRSFGKSWH